MIVSRVRSPLGTASPCWLTSADVFLLAGRYFVIFWFPDVDCYVHRRVLVNLPCIHGLPVEWQQNRAAEERERTSIRNSGKDSVTHSHASRK